MSNIGIIGAGAWGIALGINAHRNGHNVNIWHYDSKKANLLIEKRQIPALDRVNIPKKINFISQLHEAINCDILIYAAPTQVFDQITKEIYKIKDLKIPIIIASKGIDTNNNLLLDQICKINLPNSQPLILSGPGFAIDIANGLPTALTLASESNHLLEQVGKIIANNNFRPYYNNDLIGVQVGGALKNIIALATGVAMGKKLGDGAIASLISRGINEIIIFGLALGANKDTFLGLSGLGDLVLTCTNMKSRNTQLGYQIGLSGEYKDETQNLTEGIYTTQAVYNMSKEMNLSLPIIEAIYNILYNGHSVDDVIDLLINRPLKKENF
ncbi:MAG: NAD(P)-dependent glycerol-3-phosphate dehydrogenase [Hyphomicrobiales bacterium]|nr:NAD(P)-dependent glycerol-3-phosphate dehydrogenase [Hyphomicrobiales bacterium]